MTIGVGPAAPTTGSGSPAPGSLRRFGRRGPPAPGGDGDHSTARSLPAGLADVAMASATSFVVGIDAARNLDAVSLGLWGLIFSAYLLAAVVPTEFLLMPIEAALVSHPSELQLRAVPRTMVIASLIGVPASVLAMALAAGFSRGLDPTIAGRAAAVGVALGVTSPLQDHIRRLMHQAGWSTGAAMVSACQLGVVITCVVGLHTVGLRTIYIPPLALAVSNITSLVVGVAAARRRAGHGPAAPISLHRATRFGGWLLGAGVADRATQFACLALLALFVGNQGVGAYEATRVASQPVLVFALGVLSVYRRPIMRHAQRRDRAAARRATWSFTALIAAATALYGLPVSVRWFGNPLTGLTPAAFERAGLLPAVLIATAITATVMGPTTELVGSGLARAYARQIVVHAGVLVALCLAALVAGAGVFAWPLALGLRSLALGALLRRETGAIYRVPAGVSPQGPTPAAIAGRAEPS